MHFHHDSRGSVRLATTLLLAAVAVSSLSAQRMRIGSSNPTGIRAGTGFADALFAAGDTDRGVELWRYTATGTSRLIDVYPGKLSSYPTEITRRSPNNGNTWLVARAVTSAGKELGRELFYYPNLPASTAPGFIKDIWPGTSGSNPDQLTLVKDLLFFTADDGTNGRELWVSDGTAANTVMVLDIAPGSAGSFPFGLTAFNGRLFFAATSKAGTELWVSNGTAAGTVMVKDIYPGTLSSTPAGFAVLRNRLYFAATTKAEGRELWSTDGTSAGTVLDADLLPGVASSAPSQLTSGSGGLAFTAFTNSAGRQLFVKTAGAPVQHSNLLEGESIAALTAVGTGFYFRAYLASRGYELWRTAPVGIQLVHDLQPGFGSSFPSNLYPFGNGLLFRADDGSLGSEYWRTDGTTATLVRDIRAGDCSSRPSVLTAVSTPGRPTFLFAAKGDKNGIELWQTNGVVASLAMEVDPKPVLPGLHVHSVSPSQVDIDIKDGAPSALGALVIGVGISRMFTLPIFRGAISVDVRQPNLLLFFNTDQRGRATLPIRGIPAPTTRTNLVMQAGVVAAGLLEISTPGSCNQGALQLTPPNGPRVEARICLDDESGEYTFCALRTDANPVGAYVGLYQRGTGGDLQFLQACPLAPGDFIEDSGQIEILLPLDPDDSPGRHLELHLFTDPPTPDPPTSASLITTSYC